MADIQEQAAQAAVFAPDGSVRLIKNSELQQAIKSGGELAVPMKSPKGDNRWIRASEVSKAQQSGGKVDWSAVPQEHHDGFWAAAGETISGLLKPQAANPYPGMGQDEKTQAAAQSGEQAMQRAREGRSAAYQTLAPVAEAVGVDVPGMEQSAREGNAAGVMGHAVGSAAPPVAAMIGAEVVPKLAPKVANAVKDASLPGGDTLRSAAKLVRHPGRTAAAWTMDRLATMLDQLKERQQELRSGPKAGDIDVIPEEGGGPVTTPSDVPLEHIPEDAPLSPTEQKLQHFAAKGDTKAAAQLEQVQKTKPKIRASADAARSFKTREDQLEDWAFREYASNDLYQHAKRAAREVREQSAPPAKWEMVANQKAADILEQAQKQIEQLMEDSQNKALTTKTRTKTPALTAAPPEDLTSLLEQSIAAARAKKK